MHKKIYFWLAILWTALVVVLSLVSFSKAPKVFSELASYDKLVHIVFYFVFVFLWGSFTFSGNKIQSRTLFLIFFLALILGGLMEVCQEIFTQTRVADRYDMLANFVGAFLGMGALHLYKKTEK